MSPEGPSCQSCGMPMSRDPQGGGTNADGTKSGEYCSHCWAMGKFAHPDLTASQMVERVGGLLRSMNLPAPMIAQLTAEIPTLRRWRS